AVAGALTIGLVVRARLGEQILQVLPLHAHGAARPVGGPVAGGDELHDRRAGRIHSGANRPAAREPQKEERSEFHFFPTPHPFPPAGGGAFVPPLAPASGSPEDSRISYAARLFCVGTVTKSVAWDRKSGTPDGFPSSSGRSG